MADQPFISSFILRNTKMNVNCDRRKDETLSKFTQMKWIRQPTDSSPTKNDQNDQQDDDQTTNSVVQNARCKINRSQQSCNIEGINERYESVASQADFVKLFRSEGSIGSREKCGNDSENDDSDYFGYKELLERRKKFKGISKLFFNFISPKKKNFKHFCYENEICLRRNFNKLFSHLRRNENVNKPCAESSTAAPSKVSSPLNAQAAPFWPQIVKNPNPASVDSSHYDPEEDTNIVVANFSPQVSTPRSLNQQVSRPTPKKPLEKGFTRGVILNRPPAPMSVSQGVNFPYEQDKMKLYLQRTLDELNANRLNNLKIYQGDDGNAPISSNEPQETGATNQPSVANDVDAITPQYIVHGSSMPNVCRMSSSSTSLTTPQSLPNNARSDSRSDSLAPRPCSGVATDPNSGIDEFASGPPVKAVSDVAAYSSWRGQQQTSRWVNDSGGSLGSPDSRSKRRDGSTSPCQSQLRQYSSCTDYSKAADISSPKVPTAISSDFGNHSNPKLQSGTSGFLKSEGCDISTGGIEPNRWAPNHGRPCSTNHTKILPQQHTANSSLLSLPVGTNTTAAFSTESQSSFAKGLKVIPSYSASSQHLHLPAASNAVVQLTPSSPVVKQSIVDGFNQTTPRPPIVHFQVTSPQHHLATTSLCASAVPDQHISNQHVPPQARNVTTQPTRSALLAPQQSVSGPYALRSANMVVDQIITNQHLPHEASNVVIQPTSSASLAPHQSISHQYSPNLSKIHDNASASPQWNHPCQPHLPEANDTSMQQHVSSSPVPSRHCKPMVKQCPQDTDGSSTNASPVFNGDRSNQNYFVQYPVIKASAPNSVSSAPAANFMRHLRSTFQQPNTALQPYQLVADSSVKPASNSGFSHHYDRVDSQFVKRPEPIANVQHRPSSLQLGGGDDGTSSFSEQAYVSNSRSDSLTVNVQDEYLRSLVNARVSSPVSFEP